MGLDCYIRKVSKSKAHAHLGTIFVPTVGAQFHRMPSYFDLANELGYWRGHRFLNKWMLELAQRKVEAPNLDQAILDGAVILLNEEDVLSLQFELTFGDLFHSYWDSWTEGMLLHKGLVSEYLERDASILARMLRIIRCNRSYVFYTASW